MAKLRLRERKFVKEFVKNNGNATQAVLDAGYNAKDRDVASTMGAEILGRPQVQKSINELLEDAGLSKQTVLEKLQEATVAGIGKEARNSDALRGLNMVLKLYDMFPAQKKQISKVDVTLELNGKNWDQLKEEYQKRMQEGKELLDLN